MTVVLKRHMLFLMRDQWLCVPHRRLADIPALGRVLVGRGVPFETPLAGGKEGREALRR